MVHGGRITVVCLCVVNVGVGVVGFGVGIVECNVSVVVSIRHYRFGVAFIECVDGGVAANYVSQGCKL